MHVRDSDHLRGLYLLDRAAASGSRAELVANVMPVLQEMFHADEVSHTEVMTRTGGVASCVGYPTPGTAQPDAVRAYKARPLEHPWVAHVIQRRSEKSVRLSDLCSSAELRRSAFYQDFFRPRDIEYADYQTLSISGGRAVGFGVCRKDRDFTADEHDFFEHLRRPLGRIWQLVARIEALSAASPPTSYAVLAEPLTPAEHRVSDLIRRGWRTREIAQALGVSAKAVEQHITRIYRKAGVSSRAEYLMRSVELQSNDPHGSSRVSAR